MSTTIDSSVKILDSDNESQLNTGLWNGIKFKEQYIIQTVLEFVELLTKSYKDFPSDEVLAIVFDQIDEADDVDAIDYYKRVFKNYMKRIRRKEVTKQFEPTGIIKPANSAYNLFRAQLKEKAAKEGTKIPIKEMTSRWNSLSSDGKEVFIVKQKADMAKFNEERLKQEQLAMANGDIPMPKPKKPSGPSFALRSIVMKTTTGKFVLSEEEKETLTKKERKKRTKELHDQREAYITIGIKNFSKKEYKKMEDKYEKDMEVWKVNLEEWKSAEAKRIANIEAKANADADVSDASDDSDVESVDVQSVQKNAATKAKAQRKSPITKKEGNTVKKVEKSKGGRPKANKIHKRNIVEEVEDSSTDDESDDEEEVIVNKNVKKTAKTTNTSKTAKAAKTPDTSKTAKTAKAKTTKAKTTKANATKATKATKASTANTNDDDESNDDESNDDDSDDDESDEN